MVEPAITVRCLRAFAEPTLGLRYRRDRSACGRRTCSGCSAGHGTNARRVGCAPVGVEARFRATEQRVGAANGLDLKERWVDIASPPGRVRLLESGAGEPVLFINGISAPAIAMAPLAG